MTTLVQEMDEELREAAGRGNVEFLKKCVELNKPNEYYLTVFPQRHDLDTWYGNMFHIAAHAEEDEFVRQAIEGKLLGDEMVHQLLCQPCSETNKDNPLHVAARFGNVEIVKMFLNASKSSSLPSHLPKPETPCHAAVYEKKEECALEIWKMDKELLSNMLDNVGHSLLCYAVEQGLNKVAMEILSSPHSFSSDGADGYHALHYVPNCLGKPHFILTLAHF
ncbi:Delta-latroinsectotoxin-Lt1a [Bienertia sinuspersici]